MGSFIEIEDENGRLVMTVPFHEAVLVRNEQGQRPERTVPAPAGGNGQ